MKRQWITFLHVYISFGDGFSPNMILFSSLITEKYSAHGLLLVYFLFIAHAGFTVTGNDENSNNSKLYCLLYSAFVHYLSTHSTSFSYILSFIQALFFYSHVLSSNLQLGVICCLEQLTGAAGDWTTNLLTSR